MSQRVSIYSHFMKSFDKWNKCSITFAGDLGTSCLRCFLKRKFQIIYLISYNVYLLFVFIFYRCPYLPTYPIVNFMLMVNKLLRSKYKFVYSFIYFCYLYNSLQSVPNLITN